MSDRISVAALALTAAGLVGIVGYEGYTNQAIVPVPGDPPTYGFGSTVKEDGQPVRLGDKTTPPKALRLAVKDIASKEAVLRGCIRVPLTPGEWDVYVDMAYNVGPYAFCGSGFVKKLNALDYAGACSEFLRWRYVRGTDCSLAQNRGVCGGIWERRQTSYRRCLEAQP